MAFEPEQKYENPDGTPITFNEDYFGRKAEDLLPGPFADGRYEGVSLRNGSKAVG